MLTDLWELAKTAGPFSTLLLLYLFLDERRMHRDTAGKLNEVLERSTKVISEVRGTMEAWLRVFAKERRK